MLVCFFSLIILVNRGFVPQSVIETEGIKAVEDKSLIVGVGYIEENRRVSLSSPFLKKSHIPP